MAYDYDALYAEHPNALGEPNSVFVDFFATYDRSADRVLDIGCGQGRDALFIARLGHSVTGVDLSPCGIKDLTEAANNEGLPVIGIVADIATFTPPHHFDVIVIDRTLHMLDEAQRHDVLARLLGHVSAGGWVLIEDEKSNIAGLKSVIAKDAMDWTIVTEKRGTLFIQLQE